MTEIGKKIELLRSRLSEFKLSAVRLRGVDWFSWITGGGSSVVILTSEVGIAEVFITLERAFILTNNIEEKRLKVEEISNEFEIWAAPWEDPSALDRFVKEHLDPANVASDRPQKEEVGLPPSMLILKHTLCLEEWARYRALGKEAAEAMTDCLMEAKSDWTEERLAGEGARALWQRGIHPTLTLAAGEERVAIYRHPTPSPKRLGSRAMLVFCARRHGLYANLTRFVYFRNPSDEERKLNDKVALVEKAALDASRAGVTLSNVFSAVREAYRNVGHPEGERKHHQGGTTGYLSREIIATPMTQDVLDLNTALAWNPSLPGAKIEDTIALTSSGLDILTVDPRWPTREVGERLRPDLLVRL